MHYKAEIAYTAADGKYWPEKQTLGRPNKDIRTSEVSST